MRLQLNIKHIKEKIIMNNTLLRRQKIKFKSISTDQFPTMILLFYFLGRFV